MKKSYLTSAILLAVFSSAHAEEVTTDSDSAANSKGTLETITVTARKVVENLQEVPVAVNTMTSGDIRANNLATSQDVLGFTPGAEFTAATPENSGLSIRGVDSGGGGASSDTGVLVMEDGEVISRSFMQNNKTFDIGRIEVLRGPQGTTYGRNATAGVIHFIGNRPSDYNEGKITLNIGNYNLKSIEGFINGEITDGFSGRLSGIYESRDGYYEDANTGNSLDNEESYAVKAQVLYEPSDTLSVLFKTHASDLHNEHPLARKNAKYDEPMVTSIPGVGPISAYMEVSDDPWKVVNSEADYKLKIWGASVEIQKQYETFNLYSLTSFRDGENSARVDLFGTPDDLVIENSENDAQTISQELRIDNAGKGEALEWQLGLFYLNEKHTRNEVKEALPAVTFTYQTIAATNKTNSVGVFSELTYDFTEQTKLLVGARYSYDKKEYDFYHTASGLLGFVFVDNPLQPVISTPEDSWSAISGKVSLTHQFTDNIMGYASWGSGFKSGGFNDEASNNELANKSFDEETVETIEIGAKMDLLKDRLRLNLTAFDSTYDDIHGDFYLPSGGNITSNVGEASIKGVEVEILALLTEDIQLQAVLSDYDHEYTNYSAGVDNPENVIGNPVQGAPDWTATIALSHDLWLESGAVIRSRVDYRGRGDVTQVFIDDPDSVRRTTGSYNAQIGYLSEDEKWGITLWGRNLTNEVASTAFSPEVAFFSQNATTYKAPRTFGITLDYSF
ncbi:TonB-dependent receptor [Colwellia psychrerythraea]|uniref:TonB-dependent receptor n=1 Tax=Colwellia psychrerythraea TaxID=28229 RepID=A0A099K717_COLPS|nr:TonB-dependent receptor [Colwellia psychrerythraea]KGJ86574.1 TonB-dependent receptor [Colwellia psychrerythraea]